MKKLISPLLALVITTAMLVAPVRSELKPVVGLMLFGGAERGSETGSDGGASAIGGSELLGLLPLGQRFGLQGSLSNQGGHGGYRFGLSAGPVYAYDSGKFGLFGDYVYRNRGDNNFFFLRGVWSHYFENFDAVLSYSQPAHPVQRTPTRVRVPSTCGTDDIRTVNLREPSINELKGMVRYYPRPEVELNAGLLVNSFAGPDRNKTGTGFGGVFGVAIQVADWLVVRPVQGQMDTRERYRIISGVEFVWAPPEKVPEARRRVQERESAFSVASAPSSISCN